MSFSNLEYNNIDDALEFCDAYFDLGEQDMIARASDAELNKLSDGTAGSAIRNEMRLWYRSSDKLIESIGGDLNNHPYTISYKILHAYRHLLNERKNEGDWTAPLLALAGAALVSVLFAKPKINKENKKVKETVTVTV